jgi:hypothetical protein
VPHRPHRQFQDGFGVERSEAVALATGRRYAVLRERPVDGNGVAQGYKGAVARRPEVARLPSCLADRFESARRELHAALQQVRAGVDAEARLIEAILLLRALRDRVEEAAQAECALARMKWPYRSHRTARTK